MTDDPRHQSTLTPAQLRVLRFCAVQAKWVSLHEIDAIYCLEADDVLVVPSLVERKLLDHHAGMQAVRINTSGKVLAGE